MFTLSSSNVNLKPLQSTIGITFKNPAFLEQAFIHRSYLNETKQRGLGSNERLEFLGDAVLELVTSRYLYTSLPQKPEGELTNLRSSLVKTETLAAIAKDLNLGKFLQMSRGEEQGGGRSNVSLLANTVESLIGAIYLDQGIDSVDQFAGKYIFPRLSEIVAKNLHHDHKSTLQEIIQAQGQPTPTYHVVSEIGPDHQKLFTVEVKVETKSLGTGTGSSKQKAESAAAKQALDNINIKKA